MFAIFTLQRLSDVAYPTFPANACMPVHHTAMPPWTRKARRQATRKNRRGLGHKYRHTQTAPVTLPHCYAGRPTPAGSQQPAGRCHGPNCLVNVCSGIALTSLYLNGSGCMPQAQSVLHQACGRAQSLKEWRIR
eukprot:166731-Chlamydomonas_euryale.AAC.5